MGSTFSGSVVSNDHILTVSQAANALRVDADDPRLLDLLPLVDRFIQDGTGRDWTQDLAKHPAAVSAATMLLVQWYDDPGQMESGRYTIPPFGLTAALTQLEAEALKYRSYQFPGRNGAGAIHLQGGGFENESLRHRSFLYYDQSVRPMVRSPFLHGVHKGDVVIKLVGIYEVSGNQAASFEATISERGQLQQISASDLSGNLYVVVIKSPADDVMP